MADVESFDLRRQPWLPVRTVRGEVQDVSLVEAFRRADELQALTGEVPTQVLALYRLLLAVLLRAVDWDRDNPVAHWRRAWRGEVDLAGDVRRYLNRFADRFDLLHPRSPFLQVAGLRTARGEWSPLTSLIADVPNNAQYFTTRAGRGVAPCRWTPTRVTAGHAGRMSVCRASVGNLRRSSGLSRCGW